MNWHVPDVPLPFSERQRSRKVGNTILIRRSGLSVPGLAGPIRWRAMSTAPSSEPTPQRLAAIRDQLKLLADYL
jgi:hypothetical protein